jgi:hypothetical protein
MVAQFDEETIVRMVEFVSRHHLGLDVRVVKRRGRGDARG